MVLCFLCGPTNSISNDGVKQLRCLQPKSSDSMKCVLNNLLGDSGITASDEDFICQNCEVLCREFDALEYERLTMRKVLRRLIHSTYQVNNLDKNLCQLDQKALGQFKLNGTCYFCKKCDFKTKRFAHITPHHTIHQIKGRRGTDGISISPSTSSESFSALTISPTEERNNGHLNRSGSESERKVRGNEIFEFNIDSHEGDCLYSIEDVSIKLSGKEKNDEFEYDLYYPEDCEDEKTEKSILDLSKKNSKTVKKPSSKFIPRNTKETRCRRLDYLYALHCGCSHCEQVRPKKIKENSPCKAKKEPIYKCPTCKQTYLRESTYRLHERWCQIKSAVKYHAKNKYFENLRCKNVPSCSGWLEEKKRVEVDEEDDDDFFDLGVIDIDDGDLEGSIFDKKFEAFLRKTMLGLNTIDIGFLPI